MTESGHEAGSVSRLIPQLRRGDPGAVQALWQRFYNSLVRVAAARLDGSLCRPAGPEDIALEAILELCAELARANSDRRFPRLHNRDQLWRLLVCFTARAAFDFNTREGRRRDKVTGESALGQAGFSAHAGREPPPEFVAAVDELLAQLPDESLQQVALMRMEGYSNAEIARRIGRAVTTVETKLKTIRAVWRSRGLEGEGGSA